MFGPVDALTFSKPPLSPRDRLDADRRGADLRCPLVQTPMLRGSDDERCHSGAPNPRSLKRHHLEARRTADEAPAPNLNMIFPGPI